MFLGRSQILNCNLGEKSGEGYLQQYSCKGGGAASSNTAVKEAGLPLALLLISHFPHLQLLLDLGILTYSLLDYGITDDQERRLSPPLESLIEWLTNNAK